MLVDAYARQVVRAAVLVEGVQSGAVVLQKQAPVKLVRAVLRDRQDLRARVAAELRRVDVGDDAHLFDGLLIRRDDGRAPVAEAVDARPVYLKVVRGYPLAVRGNLRRVLRLEDAARRAARPRRVRQVDRAARAPARGVAEDAGRQAGQLVRVAAELRELPDLRGR